MQHRSSASQPSSDVLVRTYLRHLRAAARMTNHIDRFYLCNTDALAALEATIMAAGGHGFAEAIEAQYRRWQAAMGPRKWREVVAYNAQLGDADCNWLLDAMADEDRLAVNHAMRANATPTIIAAQERRPTHAERH